MSDPDGPGDSEADTDVAEARERVIEAFARSAEVWGLNRSYGRLYGILYFADEPLSLDDLVEQSGYAKSTVSTAMKHLERLYFVERRSLPDAGKRAYFEAQRDYGRVLKELLNTRVRREIDIMQRALTDAETILAASEGDRAERDLRRVRQLQRIYDGAARLVDIFTSTPVERLREAYTTLTETFGRRGGR